MSNSANFDAYATETIANNGIICTAHLPQGLSIVRRILLDNGAKISMVLLSNHYHQ